jgi:hypothetical protein
MNMSFSLFAKSRQMEQSRKGHAIWFNTRAAVFFGQRYGKQEGARALWGNHPMPGKRRRGNRSTLEPLDELVGINN